MATQNFLEVPTYIAIRRYPDGESWIDETKVGSTILEAMGNDIEHLVEVVLIEDGKVIPQTAHAAEIWWQHHGHEYENAFDVEPFLHDNISSQVYSDIHESRYEANCHVAHISGRTWGRA